ncbi:MAG TPA: DUF5939 domain-containing protein [Anaerolineales bacterium]|nr:DUF5939 domain-containing protein [Anaerolineales bacterium]
MAYPEIHHRWTWHLKSSPEAYWPFIADSNRFDYDRGNAGLEQIRAEGPLSNARLHLRLPFLGFDMEWEEEPFEWVRPYRFGVKRRFINRSVDYLNLIAELQPQPSGGCDLIYQIWVKPKNLLGVIFGAVVVGLVSRYLFDVAIRRYDELAVRQAPPTELPGRITFPRGGRHRLATQHTGLIAKGAAPDLANRLKTLLEKADDLTLSRLRPYVLSDYWGAPRRDTLEAFLLASHVGLLEFRWDVMCPLCRVSKASSVALTSLLGPVHCDTCNVDFTANLEQSVELTFRPHPSVRQVETRDFCLAGPQVTPHIIAQQLIPAGESRTLSLPLESGRYRVRALELRGGQFLVAGPGGAATAALRAAENGWPKDEPRLSAKPTLLIENATGKEQLLFLERTAWSDQSVTAAEVTSLQLFRDLFADAAPRTGEQVSVGGLAVMCIAARLSPSSDETTRAPAERNYLDIVRDAVDYEHGTLVKVGDEEVTAIFAEPHSAVRAALSAQHSLTNPPEDAAPMQLTAAIHYGPCIATIIDERTIDYFGVTVNLAARTARQAARGSIVLTTPVRHNPQVAQYLERIGEIISLETFLAVLKGFDTEGFDMWELTLKSEAQRAAIFHP